MTPEIKVLTWIKQELSSSIQLAIKQTSDEPQLSALTFRSEALLAGMACREAAVIIRKHMDSKSMLEISALTLGDFTKRRKDPEPCHHGFSFWQIDIDSYPKFIKSELWKDPVESCCQAITILQEKLAYLEKRFPFQLEPVLFRASIAAYNCGQGNMKNVIAKKLDIDILTTKGNYSADVLRLKSLYETL